MIELPKYLEVWTTQGNLDRLSDGHAMTVWPNSAGETTPIRCILTPVPDHGFVPGDRVRHDTRGVGTVCGYDRDGDPVVEWSLGVFNSYQNGGAALTRIDPDPPEERTYTEAELRDALKLEWHGYGNDLPDRVLARLRDTEGEGA